ncbi:MAG: SUMF1/EgtB/PvdO family nonheme iron enzyme, partial [Saprospiraceae bacterium]
GFYLSKYELTVKEYMTFVKETKSHYPEWLETGSDYNITTGTDGYYKKLGSALQKENNPIVGINWDDAIAYCDWLSTKKGLKYRLPTEAEWEYAARGGHLGQIYKYAGSNVLDRVAWYDVTSGNKTHEVGQKKANELGFFDMTGNVWEWCSDWYGTYTFGSQNNPTGPITGMGRINRGAAWDFVSNYARVTYRNFNGASYRSYNLGFRLARTL